jgi:hypothetical protein
MIYKLFIGVVLSACIMLSNTMEAQKCKYDFDEKDPMSDVRIRRIEVKLKSYFIVSYYRSGDDFRVELNVRFVGERNFAVKVGNELQLKLSNGEILSFKAAQDATPLSYVGGTQVMTNYAITHYCSREQMEALAEHGFSVARSQIGDETITMEVKEKKVDDNAEDAACMLID